MNSGELSVSGPVYVASVHTASFTQSGGTMSVKSGNYVYIGSNPGGSGSYNLSNGLLTAPNEYIGCFGTGSFTQSGGTHTVNNWIDLGYGTGASGSYSLSNGQLAVQNGEYIGYSGTGSFTQSGGTHFVSGGLFLGYNSGATGSYALSNGTLTVDQVSGGAGTGVFNFNGGLLQASTTANNALIVGLTNAYVQSGGANIDTNAQNITISQPLVDGGGGGGLTKYGNGTLFLTGSNTYTGGTEIAGGVLNIYADSALGNASGPVIFAGNGSLQFGAAMTENRAFTLNSGCNGTIDTQSYNVTLGGQISGSGGLTKIGYGMLTLSGTSNYSGGTTLSQGTLAVTGALTGGGNIQIAAGTTLTGSGLVQGSIVGQAGSSIVATGNLVLGDSTSSTGFTHAGTLTVGSNKVTLNSAAFATLGVLTTISGGTLSAPNGVLLGVGNNLFGSGVVNGKIAAESVSTIQATGNLTLGNPTALDGFNTTGYLTVGNNSVTLNSLGFANLGSLTTISGGTITAPNGVSLGVGCNLSGSGVVNGKIAAGYGSTIYATGNLTLGDSTSPVGFTSNGELYTNANTVTLNSANAANNKNAVVLGSLTQLDGGSLVAPNGILLNSGNNLVTTDSGGTVSGGTASRFLNLGNVQGPSSASSNWLTFNMLFKGGTGQTSGRIDFAGGFATGDSPGVNTQYGSAELGGTGTEFDIGGTTPGNGNNNYGQLNILPNLSDPGSLILSSSTAFNIVDWSGFVPTPGETFTVLTWTGTLSGSASLSVDPTFAANGIQFVPQWNSNSLVVEAVPEPSALALLAASGVGLLALMRRRKKARRFRPGCRSGHLVVAIAAGSPCGTIEAGGVKEGRGRE